MGLEIKIYDTFKKGNSIFWLLQVHGYMPKDGVRSQILGHLLVEGSFIESFVFEHQVLLKVDICSVTLNLRFQWPRVGLRVKIKFFFMKTVFL